MRQLMAIAMVAGAATATALGACGADPPERERARSRDAVTSAFAISDACTQCAEAAGLGTCAAELDACTQSPGCADVGACVGGCDPSDMVCIGDCMTQSNGSQEFDQLAACIVCNACPSECAGAWDCGGQGGGGPGGGGPGGGGPGGGGPGGGGPGGGGQGGGGTGVCDDTGCCDDCVACAAAGPCTAQVGACLADPACLEVEDCLGCCDPSDAACVQDCLSMSGGQVFADALECVVCNECPDDCAEEAQLCP